MTAEVKGDKIFFGNVGDSRLQTLFQPPLAQALILALDLILNSNRRATLARFDREKGGVVAEDMTDDQTPFREDERERVKQKGAQIFTFDQVYGTRPLEDQEFGTEEAMRSPPLNPSPFADSMEGPESDPNRDPYGRTTGTTRLGSGGITRRLTPPVTLEPGPDHAHFILRASPSPRPMTTTSVSPSLAASGTKKWRPTALMPPRRSMSTRSRRTTPSCCWRATGCLSS